MNENQVEAVEMSIVDMILNDRKLRTLFRLIATCCERRYLSENQFVCWLLNFLKEVESFLIVEKIGGRVLRHYARHRLTGELFQI